MSQSPKGGKPHPHALNIPVPARKDLDPDTQAYFAKCDEKIGFVPNVLLSYSFDAKKLRGFSEMYNDLMLAPSGLSKLEREMIAVAVSSINHCFYCLTAHQSQQHAGCVRADAPARGTDGGE